MKVRSKFSDRSRQYAPIKVDSKSGEIIDDGRTQAHFQAECDINNILHKYRKTGVIQHVKRAEARYGDFTQYGDLGSDLDKIAKATASFEMLPAELRNKFKNSMAEFFAFVGDEANKEKCYEYGIYERPKAPPVDQNLEALKEIAKNTAPKKVRRDSEE